MIKKHILWFSERIHKNRLDSTAAHSAYFIIISFLPFCAFILTLLQEIKIDSAPIINEVLKVFPHAVAVYVEGLMAESLPNSSIMSVSILTFLWSASSGMVAIMKGLETIYETKVKRGYLSTRLTAIFYLLALSVVLILTVITLVFGQTLYDKVLSVSPPIFVTLLLKFKSLLGLIILTAFFCLMFNAIPRGRVKFINNLLGAVFSALGWVLFSFFFSIFVDNFSNYSVVYGSLATLVVMMVWLFTCMYIIFLGGEVAVWLEYSGIKNDLAHTLRRFAPFKKHRPENSDESSEKKRGKGKNVISESTDSTNHRRY